MPVLTRFRAAACCAATLLTLVAGCRDLEGDKLEAPGTVEIKVVDNTGAAVTNVDVHLVIRTDPLAEEIRKTGNNGVARWDLVEPGVKQYWAANPVGFTGGGSGNTRAIQVVSGTTVSATITLQRTAPTNVAPLSP